MSRISDAKLRRLDLCLLIVFQEVYRRGSSSAAAARLHLTQPAISQAIKRLEELFGEPLFVRSPSGMRPTQRAREIAPKVDSLLELASEALSSPSRFDPASSERLFRVSANDFAASLLMAPLVRRLGLIAPKVRLSLGFAGGPAQAFHLLGTGGLDLAIGRFPELPRECVATQLFEEDYQVVARPEHPWIPQGLDLETYLRCQHVVVSFAGDLSGTIDADLARLGRVRQVVVASPMFLSAFAAVAASDLIATAPRRLVARFACAFGLAAYELPLAASRFRIDLIRARSSLKDRELDWLSEEIRIGLDAQPEPGPSPGTPSVRPTERGVLSASSLSRHR